MEFQYETIKGFYSILNLKCKVCYIVENIYTENTKKNSSVSFNKAAVNAFQAIGTLTLYFHCYNLLYQCIIKSYNSKE